MAQCSAHPTLIMETVAVDVSYIADLHEQCTEIRSDETVLIVHCILDQNGNRNTITGK